MTERRLLYASAVTAPLLATVAMIRSGGASLAGAVAFVAIWTAYTYVAIAVAALDLRRAGSRGHVALAAGLTAIVIAIVLTIGGGFVVLPALCLIPLAASVGRHRLGAAICAGLVVAASALYVAVVATF